MPEANHGTNHEALPTTEKQKKMLKTINPVDNKIQTQGALNLEILTISNEESILRLKP